jgi:hypothetical protein
VLSASFGLEIAEVIWSRISVDIVDFCEGESCYLHSIACCYLSALADAKFEIM